MATNWVHLLGADCTDTFVEDISDRGDGSSWAIIQYNREQTTKGITRVPPGLPRGYAYTVLWVFPTRKDAENCYQAWKKEIDS